MIKNCIEIKDKKIPIIIRNYKKSNKIKMYFNGNILNISKPLYLNEKAMLKFIMENEDAIYEQYLKIISKDNKKMKHWYDGEKILYEGIYYKIKTKKVDSDKFNLIIDINKKTFNVDIPKNSDESSRKDYIDYMVKKLFKNNTEVMLDERLPYWERITGIKYKSFQVRDTKSKYGSCRPDTKQLYFSARLIMLPLDKVDAIIVHELAHIIHRNHSKEFYSLVEQYIPNYKEIDKWLKENVNELMI